MEVIQSGLYAKLRAIKIRIGRGARGEPAMRKTEKRFCSCDDGTPNVSVLSGITLEKAVSYTVFCLCVSVNTCCLFRHIHISAFASSYRIIGKLVDT